MTFPWSGVRPSYIAIWLVSSGVFAPWPGGRMSSASSAWSRVDAAADAPATIMTASAASGRALLTRSSLLRSEAVNALLAFAAALVALRLAGALARRWRTTRRPELAAWAWSLAAYAVAAAAIAWGEAAQWDARAFRVYYAAGALLTAPLLGVGSLLLAGVRRAAPVGLAYAGLAAGVALAMPVHGAFAAHGIPPAQDHLAFVPGRLLAIVANALGTLAVVGVAVRSLRRRPAGNTLIVAGVAAAAVGSGVAGLGAGGAAVGIAVGAALLYAGFTFSSRPSR